VLARREINEFVERGFLRVEEAFARDTAAGCRELVHQQLDVPRTPPWPSPVVRGVALGDAVESAARSPRLTDAVAGLLDGEEWQPRENLGLFVIRFPSVEDPGDAGWHIDASFEGPDTTGTTTWWVNSRSRGRGLLMLALLTDVGIDDAPTRVLVGSHRAMPERLAPFGDDGVMGLMAPLPPPDGDVALATGQAGDVYLCHPFLVHAASWPHRGTGPRILAQPPIAIHGALRVDGPVDQLSAVARATR